MSWQGSSRSSCVPALCSLSHKRRRLWSGSLRLTRRTELCSSFRHTSQRGAPLTSLAPSYFLQDIELGLYVLLPFSHSLS